MMRRLLAAASATLVAIVGLSLTTANAASLEVDTAPAIFVTQESACAPGTANGVPIIDATATSPGTAGSYSAVSLSNIPASCQGFPVDVFVHSTAGGLILSGSGTVGSGTISVGVGDYTGSAVPTVIVRIGGWLFPTNWTAPAAPVAPFVANCTVFNDAQGTSGPCTVTLTFVGGVQNLGEHHGSGDFQEVKVSVAHSLSQGIYWTADFNFAELPGLLVSPTKLGADWGNASAPQGCGDFPQVTVRGGDYQWQQNWYIGEYPSYRHDICG